MKEKDKTKHKQTAQIHEGVHVCTTISWNGCRIRIGPTKVVNIGLNLQSQDRKLQTLNYQCHRNEDSTNQNRRIRVVSLDCKVVES